MSTRPLPPADYYPALIEYVSQDLPADDTPLSEQERVLVASQDALVDRESHRE